MLVKERSELKKMAANAKNRLKFGSYNAKQDNVINYLEYGNIKISREEEILYRKVTEIIESNECIINPIGRLMDKQLYEEMSQAERLKYVLELSKTYIRLQTKYFQERHST
ncbi:MAG: hypothetical protein EOM87_07745 [Clostridia bacterium]|nr:hypothetical protein [Clostridia bacterium]